MVSVKCPLAVTQRAGSGDLSGPPRVPHLVSAGATGQSLIH